MKKKFVFLFFLAFFCMNLNLAYCFWVWTPRTRKFENANEASEDTPTAQVRFAKEQKDTNSALKEWKLLLAKFPHSPQAAQALYNIGLIYEKMGKYYAAHKAYKKLIKDYPFSKYVLDAIKKEYSLGRRFLASYKRKIWQLSKPVENPAPEIFELIVNASPYSSYAPSALYYEGLYYKEKRDYQKAQECFERLLKNYPDSSWADKAEYQVAMCYYEMSLGPQYDQEFAQRAKESLKRFLLKYPNSSFHSKAEKMLENLNEKEARHILNVAKFYLKQKKIDSAKIYLKQILLKYKDTSTAKKAKKILRSLK